MPADNVARWGFLTPGHEWSRLLGHLLVPTCLSPCARGDARGYNAAVEPVPAEIVVESPPVEEPAVDPAVEDTIRAVLGDEADAALALAARADPRLVALLLPAVPAGAIPDRTGEDLRIDLVDADVWLEGTEVVGTVRGPGVTENGAWLELDVGGGPAADIEIGFGRAWAYERSLRVEDEPAAMRDNRPEIGEDSVTFRADLGGSALLEPGHVGYAVAYIPSFDGSIHDVGAGGLLGEPTPDRIEVLAAIAEAGPVSDADMAVALAVTFGTLRGVVAAEVVPTVDADAVAWLRYAEELDSWLEAGGATWRLGARDPLAKLAWAWPAAQGVAYGQFALSVETQKLTAARYRFVVPSAEVLLALREMLPKRAEATNTASAVDGFIWSKLRYRANADLMEALCRAEQLDDDTCKSWKLDRRKSATLGVVDGVTMPLWEGVSASYQLDVLAREGQFIGDCATATTLAINGMQALGIPAVAMGWAGDGLASPTHDVPLWLDGDRFRATQRFMALGREWTGERAFVYVTLPGVHPVAFSMGREPHGWSRGGAVAGGWTSYAEVDLILREGLPTSVVGDWIDVQAAGGWPTW